MWIVLLILLIVVVGMAIGIPVAIMRWYKDIVRKLQDIQRLLNKRKSLR